MTTDEAALRDAVLGTAADIAALLGPGADAAARIPGAAWTVGEAAAHLVLAGELMADVAGGRERPYGDGTPGGLAAANAASLAAFAERSPTVLGEGIVATAEDFLARAAGRPGATEVVTPMGPMRLDLFPSYLLTHLLGHGWDIARALRRPHMLTRERALLCVPFLVAAMPRVVAPGVALTARYTLALRGDPRRWTAAFDAGHLTVAEAADTDAAGDRSDCTIVSEPVAFLLIALGRMSPWTAIARGAILAHGRRPYLAPRFPRSFVAP